MICKRLELRIVTTTANIIEIATYMNLRLKILSCIKGNQYYKNK